MPTRGSRLKILILLLSSSPLIGCEWRPPRRPVRHEPVATKQEPEQELVMSDEGARAAQTTQDIALDHGARSDSRDTRSKRLLVTKDELFEDSTRGESRPNYPFGQEPRAGVSSSSPQVTSLAESLYARDRLLVIDPNGPPLIHLKEVSVAEDVRRRKPIRADRVFTSNLKQILLYLKVRNFEAPQKIELKWMYQDQVVQRDRLNIGISPRWRTWSTLSLATQKKKIGEWRVEIEKASDHTSLGVVHFVIK